MGEFRVTDKERIIELEKRNKALEEIVTTKDYVDKAGWWGRFCAYLCQDRNRLKEQLAEARKDK